MPQQPFSTLLHAINVCNWLKQYECIANLPMCIQVDI